MNKMKFAKIFIPSLCAATVVIPPAAIAIAEIDHYEPLCFTDVAGDNKQASVAYTVTGAPLNIDIEYKFDNGSWHDWQKASKITLKDGQKLYVRNTKDTLSTFHSCFQFVTSGGDVIVSGNIHAMLNNHDLTPACFNSMFADCKTVTVGPELPATRLTRSCYQNMFTRCTGLTLAPELPAANLVDYCYAGMFSGCTSLTIAPKLNSVSLAPHCYEQMFDICGLTTAPQLPAEYLADSCYAYMFRHCPFKQMPVLNSTHLANNCYYFMFANCDQLVRVQNSLPAAYLKTSCYDHMFAYCQKLSKTPKLLAPYYASKCYEKMFKDCPKLIVQEDGGEQGKLICSFGHDIQSISAIAAEMFNGCVLQPEFKDGTPTADHSYYWAEK